MRRGNPKWGEAYGQRESECNITELVGYHDMEESIDEK